MTKITYSTYVITNAIIKNMSIHTVKSETTA